MLYHILAILLYSVVMTKAHQFYHGNSIDSETHAP